MQSLVLLCVDVICTQVVPTLSPPQTLNLPADLATLVLEHLRVRGYLETWHLNLFKDIPLTHISLSTPKQSRYTSVTDEWLQLISHHSYLVHLELSQCYKISNSMVSKLLSRLPNLRHLNMEKCRRISDAGLTSLSQLTNLEFLDLSGTQITEKTVCDQIAFLPSLTSLGLSGGGPGSDKAALSLRGLTNLQHLCMGTGSLGNDVCRLISEHTQLTSLVLPFAEIAHQLAWFTSLRNLSLLDVSLNAHIDDDVLASISSMVGITSLDLSRTDVTDSGIASIQGFTNLVSLNLNSVNIGDIACNYISEFKMLTSLQAVYGRITDAGIAKLAELPELRLLKISFCELISDIGIQCLADCVQLRSLDIGSKQITNAGILSLTRLTNLTTLAMWETSVDYVSIFPLSAALPLLSPLDERMSATPGTYIFQTA